MSVSYVAVGLCIDDIEVLPICQYQLPAGNYCLIAGTDDETERDIMFIVEESYGDIVFGLDYEFAGTEEDVDSFGTAGFIQDSFDVVEGNWEFVNNSEGLEVFIGQSANLDFYVGYDDTGSLVAVKVAA